MCLLAFLAGKTGKMVNLVGGSQLVEEMGFFD